MVEELSCFEQEYNKTVSKIEADVKNSKTNEATKTATASSGPLQVPHIQHDLSQQLSRVSIPVFNGDKHHYESWKAAFTACVDNTFSTPEYKLLLLRQSLTGEALRVIQGLGHSAAAHDVAKERLERMFGGESRCLVLRMEEIANMWPVRSNNAKDLEKYADILDLVVVNMSEAEKDEELQNWYMYTELLKKLNSQLITQYQRWVAENKKVESVATLRDFAIQEAEYPAIATETLHGVGLNNTNNSQRTWQRAFFTGSSEISKACKDCQGSHGIWACSKFKEADVRKRWDIAFKYKLCLGENHHGDSCRRICGIDDWGKFNPSGLDMHWRKQYQSQFTLCQNLSY